jgi:hypothetical protein
MGRSWVALQGTEDLGELDRSELAGTSGAVTERGETYRLHVLNVIVFDSLEIAVDVDRVLSSRNP